MKEIIREEKFTLIQFFGSIGGLLGLFLGLSVVSLVEIFYMLFLWFFSKISKCASAIDSKKIQAISQNETCSNKIQNAFEN